MRQTDTSIGPSVIPQPGRGTVDGGRLVAGGNVTVGSRDCDAVGDGETVGLEVRRVVVVLVVGLVVGGTVLGGADRIALGGGGRRGGCDGCGAVRVVSGGATVGETVCVGAAGGLRSSSGLMMSGRNTNAVAATDPTASVAASCRQ